MGCEGRPAPFRGGSAPGLHWRGMGPRHSTGWLICLLYCPATPPIAGPSKITKLPTAHPQRGVVQSGEKTGHSPSDSSGDTLGASGAGSGWSRGGGA